MSGSPRKTYMEQNNMHNSFSPLREKKVFESVWGETDLSGTHGTCKHLPLSSPGYEEEKEENDKTNEKVQPSPDASLTNGKEKGQ